MHDLWSIEISPEGHQVKNAPGAPSFAPFYARAELTEAERAKLLEAIKTDESIKQERQAAADEDESGDETTDDEPLPGFTNETVAFLLELPSTLTMDLGMKRTSNATSASCATLVKRLSISCERVTSRGLAPSLQAVSGICRS